MSEEERDELELALDATESANDAAVEAAHDAEDAVAEAADNDNDVADGIDADEAVEPLSADDVVIDVETVALDEVEADAAVAEQLAEDAAEEAADEDPYLQFRADFRALPGK